jgi:hypothetical protein
MLFSMGVGCRRKSERVKEQAMAVMDMADARRGLRQANARMSGTAVSGSIGTSQAMFSKFTVVDSLSNV